jgi:hypothetical protein
MLAGIEDERLGTNVTTWEKPAQATSHRTRGEHMVDRPNTVVFYGLNNKPCAAREEVAL